MLSFISDKLDKLAVEAEATINTVAASWHPGIVPVSADKRLVVTGYLGDKSEVKIPRGGLPACSVEQLRTWISSQHSKPGMQMIVWNLSGTSYRDELLKDHVVEYRFPGFPCPPFKTLEEIVNAVYAWLTSDSETNVAVLHDITGRRSAVVAACVMLMLHKDAYTPDKLLRNIADQMGKAGNLIVPSQYRYVKYFAQHLQGLVTNKDRVIVLQRMIVNGIPDFVNETGPVFVNGQGVPSSAGMKPIYCRPFLKIFKDSKLIAQCGSISKYKVEDGCFSLIPQSKDLEGEENIDPEHTAILSGDLLIKVFHDAEVPGPDGTVSRKLIPMFSTMFNTNFISDNVYRLVRNQLDGAIGNARFPQQFFLDLIFTPANAKQLAMFEEKMQRRRSLAVPTRSPSESMDMTNVRSNDRRRASEPFPRTTLPLLASECPPPVPDTDQTNSNGLTAADSLKDSLRKLTEQNDDDEERIHKETIAQAASAPIATSTQIPHNDSEEIDFDALIAAENATAGNLVENTLDELDRILEDGDAADIDWNLATGDGQGGLNFDEDLDLDAFASELLGED